jgi:hypothetical protein
MAFFSWILSLHTGRHFNEVGNVEDWWSNKSLEEFAARAKCFINQYNQYSVPGGQVRKSSTDSLPRSAITAQFQCRLMGHSLSMKTSQIMVGQ